jgi:flagellar basal body-associated protein FliL
VAAGYDDANLDREIRHVQLQPTFVTNYGPTENGRFKYLKTDISVRVSIQAAEMAARYHLPALRNALILLLSQQDEAAVSTGGGGICCELLLSLNSMRFSSVKNENR